jgi:hypothetical protein
LRVAVREPSEYRDSREPPLFAKSPTWQIAFLSARPDGVSWELEKRGSLVERQHLVSANFSRGRDRESSDGNRTSAGRQPICKEFTDQVLFMTPGRVSEAVEGGRLISRQPDE